MVSWFGRIVVTLVMSCIAQAWWSSSAFAQEIRGRVVEEVSRMAISRAAVVQCLSTAWCWNENRNR